MGKKSFSSVKMTHVTYLGKKNIDFWEGKVLELTDKPYMPKPVKTDKLDGKSS
jgi:hypothetical protein